LSWEIAWAVSASGGGDDALGKVVEAGVAWVEVVCAVVVEVDLAQCLVGECLGLVVEQVGRGVWVGGEYQDPQVGLHGDPSRAEPDAGQVLQMAADFGGKHLDVTGGELTEPSLSVPQPPDTGREVEVDLVEGSPEFLLGRGLEIPDAGERDSGFGEGADLDQVDGVLGGVAPVAGGVTAGFGQESFVVIDADGLGRHAYVPGELADGDHVPILALDLAHRARLQHGVMANMTFDRDTLRALADEGNEMALDRLADLADARGDPGELNELLDEGSSRAGHLLTRRAVHAGDLRELQRLADAGCDEASHELERLLAGPAG
jgi:hypothetical protein